MKILAFLRICISTFHYLNLKWKKDFKQLCLVISDFFHLSFSFDSIYLSTIFFPMDFIQGY